MEILKIKDGIIQGTSIAGVPFLARIVAPNTKRLRPMIPLRRYSGVAMHDTANRNANADALMHARYVQNLENGGAGHQASYHFVVDDKQIIQLIPITEKAWHAGDGSDGRGNSEFLAIEMCEHANGDRRKTERHAQVLASALLATLGGELAKHQDFSGKWCPNVILSRKGWPEFKAVIMGMRDTAIKKGDSMEKSFTDRAKEYTVENGIFADRDWDKPLTKRQVAEALYSFQRRIVDQIQKGAK